MSVNYTSLPFVDPDGDAVTLSATGLPAWLQFNDNGNGTYSITDIAAEPGTGPYVISIIATDPSGLQSPPQQLTVDCSIETPTCPPNQTIDCVDLPATISGFGNATSLTASGNVDYTVSVAGDLMSVTIDGTGGDETITITASNGTASDDCVTIITVNECGVCPELGDQTMIIDFDSPGTTGATTFGPYGTMTGTGALSFSGIFMSGVDINDVGGGQWEVVIDNSALTGGPENLIVSQDGVDCDVGTITITGSAPPVI